jgi:hypothetical protein
MLHWSHFSVTLLFTVIKGSNLVREALMLFNFGLGVSENLNFHTLPRMSFLIFSNFILFNRKEVFLL